MAVRLAKDADVLALEALGWVVSEPERAQRFLAVTGLTPADLRARAGDRAVGGAALGFLAAHEADLVACADALDVAPAALGDAARVLVA